MGRKTSFLRIQKIWVVFVTLEDKQRFHRIEFELTSKTKTLYLNKKKCQVKQLIGLKPTVLFTPDDLQLIKSGSQIKRDIFDDLGAHLSQAYAQKKRDYEKIVHQRNKLLKQGVTDENLSVWTEQLYQAGTALLVYRVALLQRLLPYLQQTYQSFHQHEEIDIQYKPSWSDEPINDFSLLKNKAFVIENLQRASNIKRQEEIIRAQTLVGPHRDEISFLLDKKDARYYGSQGQQRSIVLALKIGSVQFIEEITGQKPLVLLDDVMSELDDTRRQALISLFAQDTQCVITTTHLEYFEKKLLTNALVVNLHEKIL